MAVSPDDDSTPSPTQIDAIATRRFSNSFRGWDPDEVRAHLVGVAEMVRALTHRQSELERRLAEADAAARRADLTRLDPDEVARILGEETARVLRTARDSAAEIETKAEAQAAILTRQAADDAAASRATAEAEAERLRREAREEADAIRAAGEIHVDDLRSATEARVAEQQRAMEADLASERQVARDEAADLLATAENHAIETRREAAADAERMRAEASQQVEASRVEAESDLAARRVAAEAEMQDLTDRAMAQVAEAERLRDRILSDLARKRRAARQHLEQLHAGRDRLLAAYEVIRATTDQAGDELRVVLADAKRAADEASRRVAGEELPSPEQMLAELDLARLADLPILDAPTSIGASSEVDVAHGAGSADGAGSTDIDEMSQPEAPAAARVSSVDDEQEASGSAEPTESDRAPEPPVVAITQSAALATPGHRHQGRRLKLRHDPLGGDALPDIPLTPVDVAADFESVRVLDAPSDATADSEPEVTDRVPSDDAVSPVSTPDLRARRVAEVPLAAAVVDPGAGADPTTGGGADEAVPSERPAAPTNSSATGDVVSGIFARLRAEAAGEPATGTTEPADEPEARPESLERSAEATSGSGSPPEAAVGLVPKPPAGQRESSAADAARSDSDAPSSGPASDPAENSRSARPAAVGAASTGEKSLKSNAQAKPVATKKPNAQAKPVATKKPTVAGKPTPKPTESGSSNAGTTAIDDDRLAELFERRDAAVDETARRLAKHLKRSLSDHQSDLLDQLRRDHGTVEVDAVLGDPDAFGSDWATVIRTDLAGAVAAGVALAGDVRNDAVAHRDVDLSDPVGELLGMITGPLRTRLARALGEGASDDAEASDELELADRIRACYREWRGPRMTSAVADVCAEAFGLGVLSALPEGIGTRWFCGPVGDPCPDCFDNQLAEVVAAGEEFPTGQRVAPAHPGCRCLALPATG